MSATKILWGLDLRRDFGERFRVSTAVGFQAIVAE